MPRVSSSALIIINQRQCRRHSLRLCDQVPFSIILKTWNIHHIINYVPTEHDRAIIARNKRELRSVVPLYDDQERN